MTEPSKAVDSEDVCNGADVGATTNAFVGDVAVCGISDTEDVAQAAHLESFETANLRLERSPGFGTV